MKVKTNGRWFATIEDELDTEIRDLLKNEDITSDEFDCIADAANAAMVSVFANDLNERYDRAAAVA